MSDYEIPAGDSRVIRIDVKDEDGLPVPELTWSGVSITFGLFDKDWKKQSGTPTAVFTKVNDDNADEIEVAMTYDASALTTSELLVKLMSTDTAPLAGKYYYETQVMLSDLVTVKTVDTGTIKFTPNAIPPR